MLKRSHISSAKGFIQCLTVLLVLIILTDSMGLAGEISWKWVSMELAEECGADSEPENSSDTEEDEINAVSGQHMTLSTTEDMRISPLPADLEGFIPDSVSPPPEC